MAASSWCSSLVCRLRACNVCCCILATRPEVPNFCFPDFLDEASTASSCCRKRSTKSRLTNGKIGKAVRELRGPTLVSYVSNFILDDGTTTDASPS